MDSPERVCSAGPDRPVSIAALAHALRRSFLELLPVAMVLTVACSSPNVTGPSCVVNLAEDCHPLHDPPAYNTIFAEVLQPTCAQGMSTCHTADAKKGGLVFENADDAYALLLGTVGGRARVIPGDPACSPLVIRLESPEPTFRMPPGPTPLLASARCEITRWIGQGAAR
jgi:hypothetical protein